MSETTPIERRMLGAAEKDYNSECAHELREGAAEITTLRAQLEEARAKAIERCISIIDQTVEQAQSEADEAERIQYEDGVDGAEHDIAVLEGVKNHIRALLHGSTK